MIYIFCAANESSREEEEKLLHLAKIVQVDLPFAVDVKDLDERAQPLLAPVQMNRLANVYQFCGGAQRAKKRAKLVFQIAPQSRRAKKKMRQEKTW